MSGQFACYSWLLLLWRQLEEDDSASLPGPAIVSNSRLLGLSHPNFKSFARAMGYNPAYLSRSIKKSWDSKSPAALLRAGRLQVAEGLLRTGNLSVRQIARAVRYSGPNAFAAAFKRCYGMTPLRYRHTFRLGAAR